MGSAAFTTTQYWTVPPGVTEIEYVVVPGGGQGAVGQTILGINRFSGSGGNGGNVAMGTLAVMPGQLLLMIIGGPAQASQISGFVNTTPGAPGSGLEAIGSPAGGVSTWAGTFGAGGPPGTNGAAANGAAGAANSGNGGQGGAGAGFSGGQGGSGIIAVQFTAAVAPTFNQPTLNFNVTGSDARFDVGNVIGTPRAFAIEGSALMTYARQLPVSPGSFAVTASDAFLDRGNIVLPAFASFAITGHDASFKYNRGLAATPGRFAVEGSNFMTTLYAWDGWQDYNAVTDPSTFRSDLFTGNTAQILNTEGRFGGNALEWWNSSSQMFAAVPNLTDFWMGEALYMGLESNLDDVFRICDIKSVSGIELTLKITNGGVANLYNASGTLLASSTVAPSINLWHWLEIHYVLGATTGTFEVWLDNAQILDYTGDTLSNGGVTEITSIMMSPYNETTNAPSGYLGAWYLADTRLGDSREVILEPNADATPNDGTPSTAGAHYLMVDENPGFDTSNYVTLTNTAGQEERYDVPNPSDVPGSVWGVAVTAMMAKSDAGVGAAHVELVESGIVGPGASTALLTSYTLLRADYPLDLVTGNPWSPSALNGLKVGVVVD